MTSISTTADAVARNAARRRSRTWGILRVAAGVGLAMLAVAISYWTGKANLAGADPKFILALGAAGVMSAVLALVVVGRSGG